MRQRTEFAAIASVPAEPSRTPVKRTDEGIAHPTLTGRSLQASPEGDAVTRGSESQVSGRLLGRAVAALRWRTKDYTSGCAGPALGYLLLQVEDGQRRGRALAFCVSCRLFERCATHHGLFPRSGSRKLKEEYPAMTYSPTALPRQYHRRRRA